MRWLSVWLSVRRRKSERVINRVNHIKAQLIGFSDYKSSQKPIAELWSWCRFVFNKQQVGKRTSTGQGSVSCRMFAWESKGVWEAEMTRWRKRENKYTSIEWVLFKFCYKAFCRLYEWLIFSCDVICVYFSRGERGGGVCHRKCVCLPPEQQGVREDGWRK